MANSLVVGALRILLTANSAEFEAAMKSAASTAKRMSTDLRGIGTQLQNTGTVLTKAITVPLVGIGAGAAKLAIDFESSFAGVRKTVNATEGEFAVMAQSFRDLSKQIPININDLNRLGEAAGALGIPKASIVDFARVMALVGQTTNVTADQAAESIAKIQNIFGAAGKDTERFASTLVALGNNGASTESQILEMATRIAGAGNTIGLTQGQVLGFASALSSVGLEAEAGGTAISKVFINMAAAVSAGGKDLDQFAKVAGVSAAEFSQRFKTDAAGAVLAFIEGLQRIKSSGGDLIGTLADMDIKEVRLRDTMLRVAGAGDLVRTSLATQQTAWEQNTALTEEARKRFETTESQLTLLWNRLKDVGITLGNALLPAINGLIGAAGAAIPIIDALAKAFAVLPTWVQNSTIGFLALAAAVGPVTYVFGTVATGASTIIGLFTKKGIVTRALTGDFGSLGTAASKLSTALGGGAGVGVAGGALAAMYAMNELEKATRSSIERAREGSATWGDLPGVLMNAVSRGLNPFGAAWRDITGIIEKFPAQFRLFKDTTVRIAQDLYAGVSQWLVDKFAGIVESLRAKVEAVKGYFKDLYDKVIGHSYVPDLVSGIGQQFGLLQGVMVEPTRSATAGVGDAFRSLGQSVTRALGDMLLGATSWKDGLIGIFRSLQQTLSQIVNDLLQNVLGRLTQGFLNTLTGAGGFGSAFGGFGGFLPGLGGGGGGAPTLGIDAVLAEKGITAGAVPWWSTGLGGGLIGGGAGAAVGWGVGSATGNKWGGAGAGAGTGAGVGAILGGPIGAGIGALIGGIAGWIGAKRANVKANDNRDTFLAQFGGQGTGEGSGFLELAKKLTEATGEAGGGTLFKNLIKANDPKELAEAIAAVNAKLAEYEAKTKTAADAEAAHAAEIEKTKAALEEQTKAITDQMKGLDDELARINASEAPEEHMGTVERLAKERIQREKDDLQRQLQAAQEAAQAAIDAVGDTGATSTDELKTQGQDVIDGLKDGFVNLGDLTKEQIDRIRLMLQELGKNVPTIRVPVEYDTGSYDFPTSVPGHAAGGVFGTPHLARIAEGGQPEMVGSVGFMSRALEGALARVGGSTGRGETVVILQVDGREFARAIAQPLPGEVRRLGVRVRS